MLVTTLNSLGTLGAFGTLGKHGPKDQYYQKAKEFTLCLDEIAKNYDKQISAIAASASVGKQLAQSFATYRKVAAFHQPIFPIVEFLQKSTTWLTSAEDLNTRFFSALNDKTFTPTKNNVKSHISNLKAIKAKNIQNEKLQNVQTLRREEIVVKKSSEQCAYEIEEMTMSSLYNFWESYLEYFEEGQKLMHKVKDGVLFMKKLSAEAAKAKRLATKKVFGVSLEELAEREAPAYLPQVLENMLATINKLVSLEGIFRVSGSKIGMDSLRESIDAGGSPDFNAVPDPHTVPSLFKYFLRMLPVPLIPYENFEMVPNLNVPGVSTPVVVNHLRALVHSLPPAHYHLLGRLLALCSKIVAEKATTKMNASNIAVVIGPNIIRTPENPSTPDSFGDSNSIVQLLVEHFAAIYPEQISTVHEEPVKPTASVRKLRAHGVTIDRATMNNLNWEAQVALANQEQPFHSAQGLSRSTGVQDDAALAAKDTPSAFRPATRTAARATRSNTAAPLSNGFTSSRNNANKGNPPGSFLAPTRVNGPASPVPPASSAPSAPPASSASSAPPVSSMPPASSASSVPSVSSVPPASSAAPSPSASPASPTSSAPPASPALTSHSPKYPIIGYHPKVPPANLSPPLSSTPSPTTPPSPTLAVRPRAPSASPPTPVSLTPSPASSTPSSSASPFAQPGKKVIIGKPPATYKKPIPFSASTPNLPAFTPDPAQPAQTTQAPAAPTQQPAPAQASAAQGGSFRAAQPSARDAQSGKDATLETVKADILRTLSNIVTGQIRVVRGKFAEVNSIPDGVPFIHVLKAVTPELDKLKKVMPTPPTFEKLPELPPDHTKFTRLKFTIDFALKDFTRALEHVGSYVAEQDNPTEIVLLQNILQVISELHRILAFNINKL